MFLQNKYSLWYNSIITRAKSQERTKKDGNYYESHHIIPKSLGGNNSKENLVLLTAREHYICHLLLPKMCIEEKHFIKMIYAFYHMNNGKNHKSGMRYNSKLYEYHRCIYVKETSGYKNPMFGKTHSDKNKQKQSEIMIKRHKDLGSTTLGLKRNDLSERNKLPKMWINNGQIDKQILKTDIENYDFNIWKKGRLFKLDKKPSNILKRRNGEIIILPEWLKKNTYQDRIRKGWKHEDAISIPLLPN